MKRLTPVSRYSDIILPRGCDMQPSAWLHEQPDGATVVCRNKLTRHGNAGKRSHNAKSEVKVKFIEFIDMNSAPNGRMEGSHGATYYFNPKFSMILIPNTNDPQYAFKCKHSVLHEFNRSLEDDGLGNISASTCHSWLKESRSYVSIMPLQSDYCDKCKEYKEEISRAQQIANRLKQSGHSFEQCIRDQEQIIVKYTGLLQDHKEEAQNGLEYYKDLVSETHSTYMRISMLEKQPSTPKNTAELNKLKKTFSAFISADYMMGKNLPHWGSSAQPSKTYYMMKLVHGIFGLVDHTSKIKYAYLCDEVAAGPQSTDHTITFFDHFTKVYIDNWVRHLTLCLDNARICKNQYLVAWAVEMVESGRFDSIRFIYLTVGHTKFAPDQLFSSIANTFYNSDVFCIEMLHSIVQQYATSNIFTSRIMLHWRAALTVKYSAVCGITDMRDILVSMKSGKVYASYRKQCFQGDYHLLPNYKFSYYQSLAELQAYEPVKLSDEKIQQLRQQNAKYIKQDVPLYQIPPFLAVVEPSAQHSANPSAQHSANPKVNNDKRQCTLMDRDM